MNNTTYSYIVLPHVVFSHGDFVFFFSSGFVWHWHMNFSGRTPSVGRETAQHWGVPREGTQEFWEASLVKRFGVHSKIFLWQNVCKIHHDETMRWWDRYDQGMIRVCFTNYLSENGRCQGVEFLHDFWRHLTPRHPSRVNGKKRDVNCRRRFAICSYLKPGYGYYGFCWIRVCWL